MTLPEETLHLIERIAAKRNRSRFLDEAARFYVKEAGKANVRKLLKEGAEKRKERDLNLAQEWFSLENEV